jgi:hypothetical protein
MSLKQKEILIDHGSFRDIPHLAYYTVNLNLAYKNAVYRAIRQRPPDLTDMKSDMSIASRGQ